MGYCSSFSDRMQKIHLLSSCSLFSLLDSKHRSHPSSSCSLSSLFQLCTMFAVLFQLCTMYTVLFQLCTMYTVLIFYLAAFHCKYCENVDVLQCDSDSFSTYGIEVAWCHFYCFSSVPRIPFCFSYIALWPLISLFPLVGCCLSI